jgi:hypothetical protein
VLPAIQLGDPGTSVRVDPAELDEYLYGLPTHAGEHGAPEAA